jgi:hypothetical protein
MNMRSVRQAIRALLTLWIIAAWFSLTVLAGEGKSPKVFRAGAAKSNISPPLGISMPGGMSDRKASNIHDELYARCLVLDNGEERLAIVICDAVALGKTTILRAKQLIQQHTGIPPDHVVIAATHTHEGGATVSVFQSDADPDYLNWLAVRISDGVRRAVNNLRPARIGWGQGREERAVFNRRYFMKPDTMPPNPWGKTDDQVKMNPGSENPNVVKPAGPTDPALSILAIQDADGEPIAVLGNYTLHYVGGEKSGDISADYFGAWADIIEREWATSSTIAKPPAVAILTNGCSGNINNVDVRNRVKQPYPYHQMNKVARLIADESLRVLREVKYQDWAPLAVRLAMVELGVRKPSEKDVQDARGILDKAGPQLKSLSEIYARETVQMANWDEKVQAPVQALRIGDVGIVTFPGEAFVEMGLDVKAKSPFPLTFCIDLSNDYLGYIPTVSSHEQGGYETWRARSSFLERGAAPSLVSTALDLLKQIHSQPNRN